MNKLIIIAKSLNCNYQRMMIESSSTALTKEERLTDRKIMDESGKLIAVIGDEVESLKFL